MGNVQTSDIIGRVLAGSIGHDIETGTGSPHHAGVDQIEMTTTAGAAAAGGGGGGGATDHHQEEEEEADMEMSAIAADNPHAGSDDGIEEEVQTSDYNDAREGDDDVHIVAIHDNSQTLGSAGGGEGATDGFACGQQSVQKKRDPGIFTSISTATLSVSAAAILRPTPGALPSHDLLTVAYALDLITLLVLGILLFGLTFALALVPDNWVSAVRAAATTVTVALLVLLLFLVAFVTFGLWTFPSNDAAGGGGIS